MNEPDLRRPAITVCLVALVIIVLFCIFVGWSLAHLPALWSQDLRLPPPSPEPAVLVAIV